jgi:hypothetical protein
MTATTTTERTIKPAERSTRPTSLGFACAKIADGLRAGTSPLLWRELRTKSEDRFHALATCGWGGGCGDAEGTVGNRCAVAGRRSRPSRAAMSKRFKIQRVRIDWDGLEARRKWDRIPPWQGRERTSHRGPWWLVVAVAVLLISIGFAVVAPRLLHAAMGL